MVLTLKNLILGKLDKELENYGLSFPNFTEVINIFLHSKKVTDLLIKSLTSLKAKT